MRLLNVTALLCFLCFSSEAQTCETFKDYLGKGHSFDSLDQVYPAALSDKVLQENKEEFIKAWRDMMLNYSQFLKKNGVIFESPTRVFQRVYFSESGDLDHFFYQFKPGSISKEKEEKFQELLDEFMKDYKLPIKGSANFAQCGPVVYNNK